MKLDHIDKGSTFDWGRASIDYAKYRDIYPDDMYAYLHAFGVGQPGQSILDIGTGTGVLPRHLYSDHITLHGIDISGNQIEQAKRLAYEQHMSIDFTCTSAEAMECTREQFDVITACQCFTYFDHTILASKLYQMLKKDGIFVVLYMAWLPDEDEIAGKSEELVLRYQPNWNGCHEKRRPIELPDCYNTYFKVIDQSLFDVDVAFTKEAWNGRMKTCRGIEASLSEEMIHRFDVEHQQLLDQIAPEQFTIRHYIATIVLQKQEPPL